LTGWDVTTRGDGWSVEDNEEADFQLSVRSDETMAWTISDCEDDCSSAMAKGIERRPGGLEIARL